MTASELLRHLHVPGNYIGFRQLCRALELSVENEDLLLNLYREVYGPIAAEFGTTPKAVEKNIRTVLSAAWLRGCKKQLQEIMGFSFSTKPSTGEFLDLASDYLSSHLDREVLQNE